MCMHQLYREVPMHIIQQGLDWVGIEQASWAVHVLVHGWWMSGAVMWVMSYSQV